MKKDEKSPCDVLKDSLFLQSDFKKKTMAKKQFKSENATPMVSEPALAYQAVPQKAVKKSHKGYMTVDEYFDKVKKALDKRYENL